MDLFVGEALPRRVAYAVSRSVASSDGNNLCTQAPQTQSNANGV